MNMTSLLYFAFLVSTQSIIAPRCCAFTVNLISTKPSSRHLGVLPNVQPSCQIRKFSNPISNISDEEQAMKENIDKELRSSSREKSVNAKLALMQSIGIVPAFRRLTFLILSVFLVQTFRSGVLQIPKSDKKFFDECPWPFTFFHDPIKALKDCPTWVVIVWAVLCHLYSRFEQARSLGGIPSITMI